VFKKKHLVEKHSCKVEPYGRTGTRNRCCKWVEINGLKRNEICHFKGPATYVYEKSSCRWKRLDKTRRQRECCTWTRTRINGHNKDSNKVCRPIGLIVEIKKQLGCFKRPFGAFGLRNYCCSHKMVCIGKTCKIKNRQCSYRGPIYTEKRVKRCKWAKKTKRAKQVLCCKITINCKINQKNKTKKCAKRDKKCKWVGKIIVTKRVRTCTFKAYGRKGLRRHCCTFHNVCKNKKCRHENIRCGWEGCARYQRLKYSCAFVHIRKDTIRKQCCSWSETTSCKSKTFSSRRCRYIGQPIITKTRRGCKWIVNGKNRRQKRCCEFHRQCQGRRCHKSKKCEIKVTIFSKSFAKCHWKKIWKILKKKKMLYLE